jgi:mono/diheme cytochrome c family protein
MKIRNLVKPGMVLISLTVFFAAFAFSVVFSSEQKKGNQAKGRYYFRQACKNCHAKGGAGGEVTPLSKTMAQWKTYFANARHSKGTESLIKVMPAEQINDVGAYLVEHAADSLQPETCGK